MTRDKLQCYWVNMLVSSNQDKGARGESANRKTLCLWRELEWKAGQGLFEKSEPTCCFSHSSRLTANKTCERRVESSL